MSDGSTTWTFTYDAGGMRTQRTNGSRTDKYVYSGGLLMQMQRGTANTLDFTYDAAGRPTAVSLNGTLYYYITNLQGDITAIVDTTGATVVQYTYDAWGNILSTTGTLATTLGQYNPLRYRGYVYDQETGLYYLQSRYYNPEIGRFINGDNYATTGQGFIGNNMFAYCGNNPVNCIDSSGALFEWLQDKIEELIEDVKETVEEAVSWFSNSLDHVLVVSCNAWQTSSTKMGQDYADAIGTEYSQVLPATNESLTSAWNTVNSKHIIIHTHGSSTELTDNTSAFRFGLQDVKQLPRNYNIQNVVITACSVGGKYSGQYNMGQLLSTKIAPDGYVICSTTTVDGDDTYFKPKNGGFWVVYQNGRHFASFPGVKMTMEDFVDILNNYLP